MAVYVNAVMEQLPASNTKLNEIRIETEEDEALQKVIETMKKGWPKHKRICISTVKPYWSYKDDLTVVDGILLKGDKIVIPTKMRPEMLKKIHEGHLGISKCKWRARQSICWLGMSQQIEECINKCETCMRWSCSKPK